MSIESIICPYNHREINVLKNELPENYVQQAAQSICKLQKGYFFIFTGFYCMQAGETDGPVGSFFLAKALQKMGFKPVLVSDLHTRPYLVGMDFSVITHHSNEALDFRQQFLQFYNPVAFLSIERCGRAEDGKYYNMKRKNISEYTVALDQYFIEADDQILTLGIGDGGNEIGMGNLHEIIQKQLHLIPSVVPVKHLIASSVSNWGAFGLIRALEIETGLVLFPEINEIENYLKYIVDHGAVDSILGAHHYAVDGFDFNTERTVFENLKAFSSL